MDISNMKNMIVLKNLPSNLVEEAIVILKANKKIKRPEYIENKQENFKNVRNAKEKENEKNYVVKEAELVISNYIARIEQQDIKGNKQFKLLEKKYRNLKACTIGISVVMVIACILNIV